MPSKTKFTDRFLKSIKPAPPGQRVVYWDADTSGLAIRVSDKSHAGDIGSFVLCARYGGSKNPTMRAIGDYPGVSLADARETAREWRGLIAKGIDPKEQKAQREREEARRREANFAAVAEDFIAQHVAGLRTHAEVSKAIRSRLIAAWGPRPVVSIARSDAIKLIRAEAAGSGPYAARRLLAYCKKLFSWAIAQDCYGLEHSPADHVKARDLLGKAEPRQRVLTDAEIRKVWIGAEKFGYPYGDLTKFLLLTGQRLSECAEATWAEFDLDAGLWTISASRMKGNAAHEVPLSKAALDLLRGLPEGTGPFVFSATPRIPGATAVSGFSAAKRRIDELSGVSSWRFHDCRRTMRTNLGGLPIPSNVAELCIAHAQAGMHKVYDRHSYRAEKLRAFELWSNKLASIVGDKNANITPLRRAGEQQAAL